MSKAEKALGLCVEYVRLSDWVKQLGRDIGDSLFACPAGAGYSKDAETHLKTYYRNVNAALHADGNSVEVKGCAEFRACPHCVKADALIQDRKTARRKLGAVKSQITKLGRAAA